ncbi:MAG TPA: hypothetical protein VEK38_04230 [Candidatus Bathyarchaeia archaeon]|nr:hypothetical protein [Candidatus Bathyarchaeia archaeon]
MKWRVVNSFFNALICAAVLVGMPCYGTDPEKGKQVSNKLSKQSLQGKKVPETKKVKFKDLVSIIPATEKPILKTPATESSGTSEPGKKKVVFKLIPAKLISATKTQKAIYNVFLDWDVYDEYKKEYIKYTKYIGDATPGKATYIDLIAEKIVTPAFDNIDALTNQKVKVDTYINGQRVEKDAIIVPALGVADLLHCSPFNIHTAIKNIPDKIEDYLKEESPTIAFCAKWAVKPFTSWASSALTPMYWINKKLFGPAMNMAFATTPNSVNTPPSTLGRVKTGMKWMSRYCLQIGWGLITKPTTPGIKTGEFTGTEFMAGIFSGGIEAMMPSWMTQNLFWKWMGHYYLDKITEYIAEKSFQAATNAAAEEIVEEVEAAVAAEANG